METKFNELFSKLSELKIIQEKGDWAECLPDSIWNDYFKGNFKEVSSEIAVDTHRWYETSITVVEIFGELLGIRYITNMFSESQSFEDCYVELVFYKMEAFTTTSYRSVVS